MCQSVSETDITEVSSEEVFSCRSGWVSDEGWQKQRLIFVNKLYVSAWEWKSEAQFSSDGIYVQQCTHIWFQNGGPGFMKRPNGTLMCRRCPGGGCSQRWCMCLMKTNRFDGPNQDYPLINTTFSRFLANLCWIKATFQLSSLRLESRALKTERMQDFRYIRPSLVAQPR